MDTVRQAKIRYIMVEWLKLTPAQQDEYVARVREIVRR